MVTTDLKDRAMRLCERRHIMAGPAPGVPCGDCAGIVSWLEEEMKPRIIMGPMLEQQGPEDAWLKVLRDDMQTPQVVHVPQGEGIGLIAFLVGAMLGVMIGAVGISLVRAWFWS